MAKLRSNDGLCINDTGGNMRLWIDTEFNGYKGELLSMALIDDDGREWYEVRVWHGEVDPWVAANVVPVFDKSAIPLELKRLRLRQFLGAYDSVHVVADWPEDIEHFCALLIIGPGERIDTPPLTMEVRRDLNTTGSLMPHNAIADARDLRRQGLMHNAKVTGAEGVRVD
jgi:hypothetical protein